MIDSVGVKLLSMQLESARTAIADAQAAPAQPADPAAQAGAVLELSAAAQALMSAPPDAS